jgi:hypothetical protein
VRAGGRVTWEPDRNPMNESKPRLVGRCAMLMYLHSAQPHPTAIHARSGLFRSADWHTTGIPSSSNATLVQSRKHQAHHQAHARTHAPPRPQTHSCAAADIPCVPFANPVGLVPGRLQLAGDQRPPEIEVVRGHTGQVLAVVQWEPARHEASAGWRAVEVDQMVRQDHARSIRGKHAREGVQGDMLV